MLQLVYLYVYFPCPLSNAKYMKYFSYNELNFRNRYLRHFKPFLSPFKCTIGVVSPQHWCRRLLQPLLVTRSTNTPSVSEGLETPHLQDGADLVFLVHRVVAAVWAGVVCCSSAVSSVVGTVSSLVLYIESGQ